MHVLYNYNVYVFHSTKNSKMINATGNSKKDAQQKAATLLLKYLDKQ